MERSFDIWRNNAGVVHPRPFLSVPCVARRVKKRGRVRVQFLPFANYRACRDNNGIVRLRRRRLISRLSRGASGEPDTSPMLIGGHPSAVFTSSAYYFASFRVWMNDCSVPVINAVQYRPATETSVKCCCPIPELDRLVLPPRLFRFPFPHQVRLDIWESFESSIFQKYIYFYERNILIQFKIFKGKSLLFDRIAKCEWKLGSVNALDIKIIYV